MLIFSVSSTPIFGGAVKKLKQSSLRCGTRFEQPHRKLELSLQKSLYEVVKVGLTFGETGLQRAMLIKSVVAFGATLGVGRIPVAPGTFGSLLAIIIWWFLLPLSLELQVVLIFVAFAAGSLCTYFYEKWNRRHDPKEVVVDELVGMWITLLGATKGLWIFLLGFLFFRLFDIWKPFPIGWLDRKVPGALGTMLDDVVAGLFALILVQLIM